MFLTLAAKLQPGYFLPHRASLLNTSSPFIQHLLCGTAEVALKPKPKQNATELNFSKTEIETFREEIERLNAESMVLRDAYAALLKERERLIGRRTRFCRFT